MIHRRVIIRCLFVILPAAAIAAAASSGFYAGTTSEGRGIGIHVNSNVQDSLRVRYRLYRCGGSYVKDTTIDEGRSAAIALDTFTNEIVSDTTTLGGGTPIWTLTGRFNYQTMKARTVYVNTTGTFDWTNNRLSGDSRCRASADGVTYSVRYLGTTAPGAGPSSVSAECLSSSSIRIGWNTTPGALRYAVYQSTTAEGPYGLCAYASSTSYTRSSLASNQTYYYKIRAENIWGWTDYSSSASATTAPATPSRVTATTLSDSTIRVGWDGVSGASSYSVSRSEASDGPYALVGTSATASYTDSLLSPATTYYYTITALNDEGSASVPSSYASATTAPEAPTEFTATPLSSSTVELRWSASTGATYYYIYRSTNSSSGFTYIGYTSTPSYTSGSLAAGTTYFYRIRAYRTTYSAYSEPVPALTFPAAPSGIAAFDTPSDAVEITWSPSTGATWHAVARSSSVSGPFVPLDTVKSPPLIDTLIAPGEVRYYTVAAGNASGWSSYGSPAACGVTPDAPGSLSATALSSSSILVSWSSVEGASSYRVYQSDSAETVGSSLATLASTSHTASGLSANTTYFFHVVASSPAGPSPFSDSATATTPPRAPTTVTVSPLSSSSVRITWDATAGASSYAVHRAVTTSGPFTAVATVSSLDHTDESLDDTTTYYYAVTAFGSGGESDRSTVVPGTTLAQPVLTVGKTSLTAAAREGGNPAGGSFEIGNDGTGTMDYTVTWKAPWLSVSPNSGECTDEQDVLSVSYNASTLTPGSFRDTITVEATGAEQSPREVTVTLTISEAPLPLISLNVDTLAITVRKSSSPPPSRVTVYNSGTGVLRYSVAADQPWLSVTPRSGTSSGEHDTLSVGYTVTALDTGSHFGRVVVSDVNGVAAPDTTVVALRVEPVPAPNVALSPTTIDITVTEGNVAATRKAFVRNGGDTILDYSVTSDSPWCTATPASGQSAGEMDTITLTCTAESLPPGSYTAHVVAANAAFIAESETLTVNLTVTARPVPIAVAEPARIERSTVGGSSPDSSLLRIRNAGPGTLAWRVAVEGDWLSTAPTSGSVTVGTDTMVVRYDAARLGVGTHTGRVILSDAIEHMEPETVTVILVVDPRPAPVIALAPNGFVKTAIHGEQLGVDTMWLRNEGTDTLRYRVTPTADWVLPSRTSGISTGAVDTVILAYDVSSLPAGEHYALVIVTDDTDGSVKAETLTVALSIDAATPPHIVVEPQALSRRLHPGDSTTAAITVRNGGGATVSYRLRSTRTWISVDSSTFSSMGETDTIAIVIDAHALDTGFHEGGVIAFSPDAATEPDTCLVILSVRPIPRVTLNAAPSPGDTVYGGSRVAIGWSATGDYERIRLNLSTDSGSSWMVVAESPSSIPPYAWTVTDTTAARARLRLELLGLDTAVAFTPGMFTIRANYPPVVDLPDTIRVVDPDGAVLSLLADDRDGDPVSLFVTALPSWATMTGPTTIALSPTHGVPPGVVRVIAVDGPGLADTQDVVVAVDLVAARPAVHRPSAADMILSTTMHEGHLIVRYSLVSIEGIAELYSPTGARLARQPITRRSGQATVRWSVPEGAGVYLVRLQTGRTQTTRTVPVMR